MVLIPVPHGPAITTVQQLQMAIPAAVRVRVGIVEIIVEPKVHSHYRFHPNIPPSEKERFLRNTQINTQNDSYFTSKNILIF